MNIYENLELLPQDLSGWNGNEPIFSKLITKLQPKTIIEVGSYKGQSSITMSNAVKKLNLQTKIYCVDTWLGALEMLSTTLVPTKNGYPTLYYQFLSNVVHNNAQDIIIPVPNTSYIAYRYLQDLGISAELIYIDASHEYPDVLADVSNYYQLLSPGGVMFGDDYNTYDSVRRAVADTGIPFTLEGTFWIMKKS